LAQVGGKAVLASAAQLSPPLAPSRLLTSRFAKEAGILSKKAATIGIFVIFAWIIRVVLTFCWA
jgi:hypothetical protein